MRSGTDNGTSRGAGGRPRAATATRRRLYQAAVTLIAEQGFSSTTVEEIAERAGVAKGTVYYNFASKSELFEELLRYGGGLLVSRLRQAVTEAQADGGGPVEALDAVVRAGLVFVDRYPAFSQLYVAEFWRTNRAWRQTLTLVRGQTVTLVEQVLQLGVEQKEFSSDIDVQLTAATLVGMVLVAALDWKAFQPERSLEEVHRSLSLLLTGPVGGSGPVGRGKAG